jgi:murein L,D-transpeptidase YafK
MMFKVNLAKYLMAAVLVLLFSQALASDLPDAIIRLPENENAILVEKQSQTLYVYSQQNKELSVTFTAACSTGEIFGDKKKAGDKKTPEGVYFLIDEYEDRYLTPVYGKKAFPSDYPNFYDQRLGKDGSAIWIHGTDKALKPMDSNGCIALENDNILSLSDYIQLDSTPLIIVEKIIPADAAVQAEREKKVRSFLDEWARSIEAGSYHDYLDFYSDEYVPDISWWETWLGVRKKSAADKILMRLEPSNIGIYVHNSILVVLFDLNLSPSYEKKNENDKKILIGKRKFFVEEFDQTYKIIGDTLQKNSKGDKTSDLSLITAAQTLINDSPGQASVMETVERWLTAWSSKDMDAYAGFYAPDFFSDGLGKKSWVKRKRQLAKKYNYITVTGKDFKIIENKDHSDVYFFQEYEASSFSTQGTKHLKLVRKGGLWMIFRENWKEK